MLTHCPFKGNGLTVAGTYIHDRRPQRLSRAASESCDYVAPHEAVEGRR
jgi:hypothetical protein